MRVLIADDEHLFRQGLVKKINWQRLGLVLADEASNGVEALQKMDTCMPDIVLTDVRMPGMNGLAFVIEARRKYRYTKFVIISGYDEFEYVREALKQGVKDYLLKPIDSVKLNEMLEEMCQEIRRERMEADKRKYLEQMDKLFKHFDVQALDYRLTNLISHSSAQLEDVPEQLKGYRRYMVAVAKADNTTERPRFRPEDEALVRFAILNLLQETGMNGNYAMLAFKHAFLPNEIILIVGLNEETELMEVKHSLLQSVQWSAQHLGIAVSIGLGSITYELESLNESYNEAKQALGNRSLRGKSAVFAYTDYVQLAERRNVLLLDHAEKTLFRLLERQDTDEIINWVDGVIMRLECDPEAIVMELDYFYREILHIFRKYMIKRGVNQALLYIPDQNAHMNIRTARELTGLISEQLHKLFATLGMEESPNSDEIVQGVKAHIDQHYAQEISLQWVSDTYSIHPNYFSKRFKEVWGISFSDYLTLKRVDQSKDLLSNTTLKVSTISQMVGYEDQNYFSSVFKKMVGMSPTQYRNRMLREQENTIE